MKKRGICLLLAAVMLLGMIPASFATETAPAKVEPKVIFDYNCDSLTGSIATAKSNKAPAYYFADSKTAGVEAGTVVAGSDGSAEGSSTLNFSFNMPDPSFSLEVDMKIDSLMTPSGSAAWRGLVFDFQIPGNRNVYIAMNALDEADSDGKNADIYMFKGSRSSSSTLKDRVAIPTDGEFHKWEFKFDGESEVRVFIDGELEADFVGVTVNSTATTSATLRISNSMHSLFSGTNHVVFDNIKLISGVSMNTLTASIGANSVSENFTINAELEKLTDDTEISFTVTSKDDPTKVYTHTYKPTDLVSSATVTDIPFTGLCEVAVNATDSVKNTFTYYLYEKIVPIDPGASLTDEAKMVGYKYSALHYAAGADSEIWKPKYFKYADDTIGGSISCSGVEQTESFQVPVKLNGKFAVYVGYLPGTYSFTVNGRDVFVTNLKTSGNVIHERFAVAGDFKNEEITITNTATCAAKLAYVKYVPITDEMYEKYAAENDSRNMMLDNDGFSMYTGEGHDTVEFLLDSYVDRYAETINLGQYSFAAWVTGFLNFPSKARQEHIEKRLRELGIPEDKWPKNFLDIVDINGNPMDFSDTMRDSDKRFLENIAKLNESGIPQETLGKYVTEKGYGEVYASLRMSAYYDIDSKTAGGYGNGTLYYIHPEWKIDGRNELSYYYEGYRDYLHDVLIEMANFENVAGVTMDFGRYQFTFGKECPDVAERTRIMNEFVKSVREDMPAGKKLIVRVLAPTNIKADPYGLDYKTWVKEGWVDRVIISVQGHETFFDVTQYANFFNDPQNNPHDVEFYVGIVATLSGHDTTKAEEAAGQKTEKTQYVSLEQHLLRAYDAYTAGADGIFLFNSVNTLYIEMGGPTPTYAYMNNKEETVKWYTFEYPAYDVSESVRFINPWEAPDEYKNTGVIGGNAGEGNPDNTDPATPGTDDPVTPQPGSADMTPIFVGIGAVAVVAVAIVVMLFIKKKKN